MDEPQQPTPRRGRRRRGGRGGQKRQNQSDGRPQQGGPPGPGPSADNPSAPRPRVDHRASAGGQSPAQPPSRGRTHRAPPPPGRAPGPPGPGPRTDRTRTPGDPDRPRSDRDRPRGDRDRDRGPRDHDRGRVFETPVPQDPVSIELGAKFREAQTAIRDARKALDKRRAEFNDEPDWMLEQLTAAERTFEEAATAWTDHLATTNRKVVRR